MRSLALALAMLVFALIAAFGAGSASSAMPEQVATVSFVVACDSIRAHAHWERLRVDRVVFTYRFESSGPFGQSQSLAKPARSGDIDDTLFNRTLTPFSNGQGSVRADWLDSRGQIVASDTRTFALSC